MQGIESIRQGEENYGRVVAFFNAHLCATQVECSKAIGISVKAVGRHVKRIRSEWGE